MPRLLVFVPCENVLINQDNNASLIILLSELTLTGDIPEPLPENAVTQMKWFVFTQWEVAPEEVGIPFDQRVQLLKPDGTNAPSIDIGGQFTPQAGKPIQRVVASLTFFPLVPTGQYRLHLSIRRANEQREWSLVGDYPFPVILKQQPAPVKA